MTMNSEKWAERLKHLQLTHLELDTKIKKLEQLHENDYVIKDLKKKKLKLKEDIEQIKAKFNL